MPSWRMIASVLSLRVLTFSTAVLSASGAAEPCTAGDADADACAGRGESFLQHSSQRGGKAGSSEDSKQMPVPGAPMPTRIDSETVTHAAAVASEALRAQTSSCDTAVASIRVLSAETEVVGGELIILDAEVSAGGEAPETTYHRLTVMETPDATGDMVWSLAPLANEGGEDIGWCEVMATCTGKGCEEDEEMEEEEMEE
mmetsp:Transcript_116082/g.329005  ORF Transcript_116082/g.329005 Transcript_116082/m.329005 type:complete len:200 (+) Transcript_116082:128-727(+)